MAPDLGKLKQQHKHKDPHNPASGPGLKWVTCHDRFDSMAAMVKSTGDSDTPPEPDDSTRVVRLPTIDMEQVNPGPTRTILHIYHSRHSAHKHITPQLSAPQERRWGPTLREQKSAPPRQSRTEGTESTHHSTTTFPDPTAFFLHQPSLAFHRPPACSTRALRTTTPLSPPRSSTAPASGRHSGSRSDLLSRSLA